MKKVLFFAALFSAFAFISCEKEEEETTPTFEANISADKEFVGGKAQIYVTLSGKPESNVTVKLDVATEAKDVKLIPAAALSFNKSVVFKAGQDSLAVAVTLDETKVGDGEIASITIASADGAKVGKNNVADIKYVAGRKLNVAKQSNWSVSLKGDPFAYGDSYYQLVTVTAPGIKYYYLDPWTEEELEEYYDGSVENMLLDYEEDLLAIIEDGNDINDILFAATDANPFMSYYGAGEMDVYLMEFDETGHVTGRYGVSRVTFADVSEAPLRAPSRGMDSPYSIVPKPIFKARR